MRDLVTNKSNKPNSIILRGGYSRLRNRKYTAPDGMERIVYDIVATKVEQIERPSQRV